MKRKAVYAGSFDPLTNGHMFMVHEGSKLFDELIIAIGINPEKKSMFTLEERLIFLNDAVQPLPNVEVDHFGNNFLIDYATKIGAKYILRGIRNASDFHYEQTMRQINSEENPEIVTVFLTPPRELIDISSSFVKSLIGPIGWEKWIRPRVPDAVYQELIKKFKRA